MNFGFFLFYISLRFVYRGNGSEEEPLYFSTSAGGRYLIPFIRGQGLNNQLWEYRSAAIIAKATSRRLCLVPFHRFYLQQTGRKFIPFEDLFDAKRLEAFVHIASSEECVKKCNKLIHKHLELVFQEAAKFTKKRYIADWRPGSLPLFYRSTGFQNLPSTEFINVNTTDRGLNFNSLEDIKKVFLEYANDPCVSISGTTPTLSREFLEWSRALKVNQNIANAVEKIKKEVFSNKPFMSIHWRFEETKCAGFGRGIGFGRSINIHQSKMVPARSNKKIQVRKSDNQADLCFFAGPLPRKLSSTGIWVRLVSKTAIVKWIKLFMKERNIENVYMATDCSDKKLLKSIKHETGAITKSNIEPLLLHFTSPEENDVVSRVEQRICSESTIFLGTSMSSWTSSVIEERFQNRKNFFIQDKYNVTRRPDPMNRTFYFDIEVCNCEWEI